MGTFLQKLPLFVHMLLFFNFFRYLWISGKILKIFLPFKDLWSSPNLALNSCYFLFFKIQLLPLEKDCIKHFLLAKKNLWNGPTRSSKHTAWTKMFTFLPTIWPSSRLFWNFSTILPTILLTKANHEVNLFSFSPTKNPLPSYNITAYHSWHVIPSIENLWKT